MFSLVLHPQVEVFAVPVSSQTVATQMEIIELLAQDDLHFSYDDIVGLLAAIENGELEKRDNPEKLERLSQLLVFLAREGMLPDELDDESDLEEDIAELLSSESNPYEYAYDFYREGECQFAPAICYRAADLVLCKNWFKKTAKQIGKFVKKHKKEIVIGAVVVIAAVAVVVVVGAVVAAGTAAGVAADAATAGAAATVAGAAAASGSDHKEKKNASSIEPSSESYSNENGSTSQPSMANFHEDVRLFKESLIEEQFLQSSNPGLSMEENGRILGQVFAHQSLNGLAPYGYSSPFSYEGSQESKVFADLIADKHEMVDRAFSLDSTQSVSTMDLGTDFKEVVYQLRGERAFELKHYDQAIFDFGKTIELNPHNHIAYLDRAAAYLEVGDYENSLSDYQQYTEQKPIRQQGTMSFCIAFAKALPRGVKDSGCQLGSFAYDAVRHPINTGTEVCQVFATLSKLVYSQEWAVIGETLAPEVYELVTKWDTLSSKEQGDLAGYAFGKYGSDILIPGASVKILSRGVKGAKELAIACNTLKTAEKTLVLEGLSQFAVNLSVPVVSCDIVAQITANADVLVSAGKAIDRGGLTRAGRGIMKHGYREGGAWPKPIGNVMQINEQGQKILEFVVNHPDRKIIIDTKKRYGPIMDIVVPGLGGARFSGDGTIFIGFLEP